MADIDRNGIEAVIDAALERACDGTDGVYVLLDIDLVDPVYCPAQKYPEPGGLTSKQIIAPYDASARRPRSEDLTFVAWVPNMRTGWVPDLTWPRVFLSK